MWVDLMVELKVWHWVGLTDKLWADHSVERMVGWMVETKAVNWVDETAELWVCMKVECLVVHLAIRRLMGGLLRRST